MTLSYLHIPVAVLKLADLNIREKLLLGLVIAFGNGGLRVNNQELSVLLDIWPSRVSRLLKSLEQKGYVKIENPQSRYRVVHLLQSARVESILLATRRTSRTGALATLSTPTVAQSSNTIEQVTKATPSIKNLRPNSEASRLAQLLLDLILERKPDFRKPDLSAWSKTFERLLRLDCRTPDRVEAVIRWCQGDSFWQNNILSADTLREKFDRLELKMRAMNEHGTGKVRDRAEPVGEFVR